MPRPSTPQHQRYNVRTGGRRTTVSLDYWLAGLLAVRLGEEPGGAKAAKRVRLWLQGWADKDAKGGGAQSAVDSAGGVGSRGPRVGQAVRGLVGRGRRWRWHGPVGNGAGHEQRSGSRAGAIRSLPRFARGVPPDIVVRRERPWRTCANARGRFTRKTTCGQKFSFAPHSSRRKRSATAEYYIRRCSEEFWAALKGRAGHSAGGGFGRRLVDLRKEMSAD
jgi:hypothetical protein